MSSSQWHKTYKVEVYRHFKCTCQECRQYCPSISHGVVHHFTYKHHGGIYNATASELITQGKITWLCHDCHEKIHSEKSVDGITRILTKGECISCGDEMIIKGDWDHGLGSTCWRCKYGVRDRYSEASDEHGANEYGSGSTFYYCSDCGEGQDFEDDLDVNGRCETCANTYRDTMSEYEF